MAVGFDAVGPGAAGANSAGATTLSWSHTVGAAGTYLLVGATLDVGTDTGFSLTAKYNGVAMTSLGVVHTNNSTAGFLQVWGMANPPTGSALTVLITAAGGTPTDLDGGSVSFTGAGSLSAIQTGANTGTTASLAFTPTVTGNMVAAFCGCGSPLTAGGSFTGRYTTAGAGGAGAGFAAGSTLASTGSSMTPSWTIGGTDFWAIIAVEVKALPTATPTPVSPQPVPPGWFPGANAVTALPGGIPFAPLPGTTDATPGVVIVPTPEAAAAPMPLLAPGWFPGSAAVTVDPGGIPFYAEPPPQTPAPAVVFPVPDAASIVPWLPWPPGYFPGSQSVAVDPGGIPFYSQPQPLTAPIPPPPPPAITTLAGSGAGGYFADQNGNPRMWVGDEIWALLTNAGRWNSGNYRAALDSYFATRAAQGYTICYSDMFGSTFIGGAGNGQMWDGTTPFPGGNPSSGLNEAYWSRIDYALSTAANNGITIALSFGGHWDWDVSGNSMFGLTSTQYTDAGNAIGSRYKGRPNLIWLIMDDYFSSFDASLTSFLTGLRASGDTHPVAIENYSESSSRFDLSNNTVLAWGTSNTQYNFGYSYSCTYLCIEYMYAEASPLPCIYGDGYFYQGGPTYAGGSGAGALDRAARQDAWWAVTSGARGFDLGDEALWQWPSTAPAAVSTQWYQANNIGNIRALMESLPGWHTLAPATGTTLITAGRGTRGTQLASGGGGGQYEPATTNSYVSASRTPDTGSGSALAVMYLPNATTITIDQTKMVSGYLAYWADPITGVMTPTTPGATYNSTAQGNNSRGDPDWVLVLQGTPSPPPPTIAQEQPVIPLPPGWFPGADAVITQPGGIPFYSVPQPADQNAPASAVVNATVSPATLAVTASFPAAAVSPGPATLAVSTSFPAATVVTSPFPATLSVSTSFPAATVVTSPFPATLSISTSFPAATVVTSPFPAVLTVAISFPAAAVSPGPATLAVSVTFPAATVVTSPFPATLSVAAAFPAATVVTSPFPATLAVSASFPAAAVSPGPATLAVTVTFPAPAVSPGPATLSVTASFPAATVVTSPFPATLAVTVSFPAATVVTSPFPATLAVSASFPAGAVSPGPATLAVSAAFPAPVVSGGGSINITPAVVTITAAFPAPAVSPGPATLAVSAAFPAVAVVTSPFPATLAVSSSFPAEAVSPGPATLAVSAAFPAATAVTSPFPATLAVSAAFPAAAVATGETVSASTLAASAAFPAPAVSGGGSVTITPAVVTITAAFPAPAVATGETVSAGTLSVSAAFPAPAVATGETVSPVTLAVSASFPAPVVRQDQRIAVAVVTITAAFPAVTINPGPGVLTVSVTFPAGSLHTGMTVTAGVLAIVAVLPAATVIPQVFYVARSAGTASVVPGAGGTASVGEAATTIASVQHGPGGTA